MRKRKEESGVTETGKAKQAQSKPSKNKGKESKSKATKGEKRKKGKDGTARPVEREEKRVPDHEQPLFSIAPVSRQEPLDIKDTPPKNRRERRAELFAASEKALFNVPRVTIRLDGDSVPMPLATPSVAGEVRPSCVAADSDRSLSLRSLDLRELDSFVDDEEISSQPSAPPLEPGKGEAKTTLSHTAVVSSSSSAPSARVAEPVENAAGYGSLDFRARLDEEDDDLDEKQQMGQQRVKAWRTWIYQIEVKAPLALNHPYIKTLQPTLVGFRVQHQASSRVNPHHFSAFFRDLARVRFFQNMMVKFMSDYPQPVGPVELVYLDVAGVSRFEPVPPEKIGEIDLLLKITAVRDSSAWYPGDDLKKPIAEDPERIPYMLYVCDTYLQNGTGRVLGAEGIARLLLRTLSREGYVTLRTFADRVGVEVYPGFGTSCYKASSGALVHLEGAWVRSDNYVIFKPSPKEPGYVHPPPSWVATDVTEVTIDGQSYVFQCVPHSTYGPFSMFHVKLQSRVTDLGVVHVSMEFISGVVDMCPIDGLVPGAANDAILAVMGLPRRALCGVPISREAWVEWFWSLFGARWSWENRRDIYEVLVHRAIGTDAALTYLSRQAEGSVNDAVMSYVNARLTEQNYQWLSQYGPFPRVDGMPFSLDLNSAREGGTATRVSSFEGTFHALVRGTAVFGLHAHRQQVMATMAFVRQGSFFDWSLLDYGRGRSGRVIVASLLYRIWPALVVLVVIVAVIAIVWWAEFWVWPALGTIGCVAACAYGARASRNGRDEKWENWKERYAHGVVEEESATYDAGEDPILPAINSSLTPVPFLDLGRRLATGPRMLEVSCPPFPSHGGEQSEMEGLYRRLVPSAEEQALSTGVHVVMHAGVPMYRPAKSDLNTIVSITARCYANTFAGCKPAAERHLVWKETAEMAVAQGVFLNTEIVQATIEDCAKKMGGARGQRLLASHHQDQKGVVLLPRPTGVPYVRKRIMVKQDEMISLKNAGLSFCASKGFVPIKPRAIVDLDTANHARHLPWARGIMAGLKKLWHGDGEGRLIKFVVRDGGPECHRAVRIFIGSGADPGFMTNIGKALATAEKEAVLVLAGDDVLINLGAWAQDTHHKFLESDFSSFDQSQDEGPLIVARRVWMDAIGAADMVDCTPAGEKVGISALFDEATTCAFQVQARSGSGASSRGLKIRGNAGCQMPTGTAFTTLVSTVDDLLFWLFVLSKNKTVTQDSIEYASVRLGFEVKSKFHAQLQAATFLKGWFFPGDSGWHWLPLPSCVLKMGKTFESPAKMFPDSPNPLGMASWVLGSSYGNLPEDYPVAGVWAATLRQRWRPPSSEFPHLEHSEGEWRWVGFPKSMSYVLEHNPYKPVVDAGTRVSRVVVLDAMQERYGVTQDEILELERVIKNAPTGPCVIVHPVLFKFWRVDYC